MQPSRSSRCLPRLKLKSPCRRWKVQKEIVAEIEGYQKVINGARAVLDHYRPHIPIHPDWPITELGKLCSIKTGKKDVNSGNPEGTYPFFTCAREPCPDPLRVT